MSGGGRYLASLIAVLGAVIVPLLIAGLDADPASVPERINAAQLAAQTPRIARGVEEVRELRFQRTPNPHVVGVPELSGLYEKEAARLKRSDRLDADTEVLKLLGLLDPDDDLGEVSAGSAELVAGAYDPRTKRLLVVEDQGLSSPVIVEFTLAHELNHALEDQLFGLGRLDRLRDDRLLAAQALVEGSATHLMVRYAARYQDLSELFEAALDPSLAESASTAALPDFIEAQLFFTYLRGQEFVSELVELGGDWNLVDIAYQGRLPLSTEQILHPGKYLLYERPRPVRLPFAGALGDGWRHLGGGTLGEFDTIQLLELGNEEPVARAAAAGWSGGRFELWRRAGSSCESPCRSREVLALGWRWDTYADARQFAHALRAYVASGLGGEPVGRATWQLPGGVAGASRRGRRIDLVFAPNAGRGRAVAIAIARGSGSG